LQRRNGLYQILLFVKMFLFFTPKSSFHNPFLFYMVFKLCTLDIVSFCKLKFKKNCLHNLVRFTFLQTFLILPRKENFFPELFYKKLSSQQLILKTNQKILKTVSTKQQLNKFSSRKSNLTLKFQNGKLEDYVKIKELLKLE